MLNHANSGNAEMPIPSQPNQECFGGVTTRSWSPERTVKAHECVRARKLRSKDSLTCIKNKMQKQWIKSRCDNNVTTIQNRSGVLADNVSNNNALLRKLKAKGNVRPFGGGNVILN